MTYDPPLCQARDMAKVLGIGGVFVKSPDPEALRTWYRDVLGMEVSPWGAKFVNAAGSKATWSPFPHDAKKFEGSSREMSVNFVVDDAEGILARARELGATVLDRKDSSPFGEFRYLVDPDGTIVELWQPPAA